MNRLSVRQLETLDREPEQYYSRHVVETTVPHLSSAASERGQRFHQLMQQQYLGLPIAALLKDDSELARYWQAFQTFPPPLLPGAEQRAEWPIAIGQPPFQLYGVVDLWVETTDSIQIVDWKTYRRVPQSFALEHHWQTRLYCYLAQTLYPQHQIEMLYWFTEAPQQPIRIRHTVQRQNAIQQRLTVLLAQLATWQASGIYPQPATLVTQASFDWASVEPLTPP